MGYGTVYQPFFGNNYPFSSSACPTFAYQMNILFNLKK